ncbi:MAG: hypothetical protein IPF87_13255 [Gemmatimonadetes bacterium]|nr:hypothetical protein [Gemmatimonadota bacterium]HNV76055.1 hypothetical protein [Gemmatimonadaceae bacterium]MBK6457020.1 hypothetical protein [Gemmatimonadota bacterium]MBK6843048.1 hypothetical protein [Gemmatimonadota bacterium]MBK8648062.1 hypothetical protein [Gemmatimonadota bacterium]
MTESKIVYQRELPGGGYVHVEEESLQDTETHRAHVTVERRTDPTRRDGHEPPVIARAEGRSPQSVFGELFRIAQDNVAIAKALLRLRGDGTAKF